MLPDPFIQRIQQHRPNDCNELFNALESDPIVSIRRNPLKNKSDLTGEPISWCAQGLYLDQRPSFSLDPLFHAGAYYVQEPSSMVLEPVFQFIRKNLSGRLHLLDLCAAPGGKSTHLLSLMNPDDLLISNEVVPLRNAILRENLLKWGYPNVVVSRSEARTIASGNQQFDVILADMPCSGEGMFRKDRKSRDEWSESNLLKCSIRQKDILETIWTTLRPGGFLIYSTCTFNPNENELLLQAFAEKEEVLSIDPTPWLHPGMEKIEAGIIQGVYFYPHKIKGEGFFLSVLQKPGSHEPFKSIDAKHDKSVPPTLKFGLETFHLLVVKDDVRLATPEAAEFVKNARHMQFTMTDRPLGRLIRGELQPSQEFAWTTNMPDIFASCEVGLEQALEFLRKGININVEGEKGWLMLTYKGLPLGFIKNLGNRVNNYYPVEYRLRM